MSSAKVAIAILISLFFLFLSSKAKFNLFPKVKPATHIVSLYVYLDKFNKTAHTSIILDKLIKPVGVRWLMFVGNRNKSIISRGTF